MQNDYPASVQGKPQCPFLGAQGQEDVFEALVALPGHPEPQLITCGVRAPSPTWLRVKPLKIGICGSDLTKLHSAGFTFPPGASYLVLGHEPLLEAEEGCGEIKKGSLLGAIVTRRGCLLAPNTVCPLQGTSAASYRYITRGSSAWHGYASRHAFEHPAFLLPLPDDLYDYGVLLEPVAIAAHGIGRLATGLETAGTHEVAIIGIGALGLLVSAILADRGCVLHGIDIVDPCSPRAQAFERLGQVVYHQVGAAAPLAEFSHAFPAVFEVAGAPTSLALARALTAPGGQVLALGIPPGSGGTTLHRTLVLEEREVVTEEGVCLRGAVSATAADFLQARDLLTAWARTRGDFLGRLISHRFPLGQYREAFHVQGDDRIKVVIDMM